MSEPHGYWPLFDLVVRTPRLEMRMPNDNDFASLIALIDGGIHDPATMPFLTPFTDTPGRGVTWTDSALGASHDLEVLDDRERVVEVV